MSAPRLPALFLAVQNQVSDMAPIGFFPEKRQPLTKFVMSLRRENFHNLTVIAQSRGISIQELLRAVIIPEWTKAVPRKTAVLPTALRRTF